LEIQALEIFLAECLQDIKKGKILSVVMDNIIDFGGQYKLINSRLIPLMAIQGNLFVHNKNAINQLSGRNRLFME